MRYSIEHFDGLKTYVYRFKSFGDWVEVVKGRIGNRVPLRPDHDILRNYKFRGRAFTSWEDLWEKAMSPWAEGMAMFRRMKDMLSQVPLETPRSIKRRRRWNENEGELDTDRYLSGDAICFQDCVRTRVEGSPVVTICIQINNDWKKSPQDLFWNSAAAVAVIDILEEAGYAVEVYGYARATKLYRSQDITTHFMSVCLKETGTPVDTEALVTGLSAFAFRIFGLMAMALPHTPRSARYGYPIPVSLDGLERVLNLNGTIINVPNFGDANAAAAFCMGVLKTISSQVAN